MRLHYILWIDEQEYTILENKEKSACKTHGGVLR